ncbi:MAG: single-stranded DNA-binding protein [Bacillota bacterium]
MFNRVILIGRLTKDPELRYTNQGTAVAGFTLAVDKGLSREKRMEMESQGRATANFIKVSVWGKPAELCAEYTAKGLMIAVEGRLENRAPYEYEKDGKVYVSRENEVIAESVKFLEWKDKRGQSSGRLGMDEEPDIGLGDDNFPF